MVNICGERKRERDCVRVCERETVCVEGVRGLCAGWNERERKRELK